MASLQEGIEGPKIIATATDRNYVELAGVMLRSLMTSPLPPDTRLIVFCDGLRAKDKSDLQQCVFDNVDLEFIDIPKSQVTQLGQLRANSNWSRTIYSRLLMPQLLDIESGRILYLDADTIILDSLEPLLSVDLGGHAIAAVGGFGAKEANRLGLRPDVALFNSGVMVIDVKTWRSERIGERALELAGERFRSGLPSFDQDVLNIVMEGQFHRLGRQWNSTKSTDENPAIVHFTHAKPNTRMCRNAWQATYLQFRQQTPWAKKRLKTKWDRRLRRVAFSLKSKTLWIVGRLTGSRA
jgi:lipopolysaccharide biosynthesis glycosyltransferase